MDTMNVKELFSGQQAQKQLINFLQDKNGGKIEIAGLHASAKSYAFSYAALSGLHVVILNNREQAQFFSNDLYNIMGDEAVYFFPASARNANTASSLKDASRKVQRSAAISAVNHFRESGAAAGGLLVLVTYPGALLEEIVEKKVLDDNILRIARNDSLSHEFIRETLQMYRFEKVDFVGEPGQFALRGGIIDVFSYAHDKPFRIDFFGNTVESIRVFDIDTQRSVEERERIEIFPNIYDAEQFAGQKRVNLFEFLGTGDDITVWTDDYPYLEEQLKNGENGGGERLLHDMARYRNVFFNALPQTAEGLIFGKDSLEQIRYRTVPQPAFNKNFDLLLNNIRDRIAENYTVFIASDNPKQIERLGNIFSHNGRGGGGVPRFTGVEYSIHGGFVDHEARICVYTDHQIFDRYHRVKIRREVERSERLTLNELNAFRIGDYVVHIDHGVGIFGGLVKTNVNGKVQEAIKLIYKDNDVIFVSIHGIHRISRYKSKDGTAPKIYKLGTGAWEKLKKQTKSKVKDIARDLIKLYAERRQAKGFAFSADSYLQHELEASFLYEDTPDQLKATQAVKEDMEKPCPMDRLVCGDVGFGKTEVAVRAAFKAVVDGKQVAVLVPTTILALQHYKTFRSRLQELPCSVAYISRLKTAREIRQIAEDLKNGKTDIIIGTHKLLGKDIVFKDLGLLIIDEEQKFGVAAKERLRQLKLAVDTLTLTATPIPRTLQFSLLGARDLSIINTPPPNRLPVQTEIMDFNEEAIKEIIEFEMERGGQVFFVHNRVEDILAVEDILKRICPGIKTAVGHGKMDPKELENRILDFMAGDYDVLVATSIVENGIDIPNANTIIINQAQNFGLSDLHQLRGRVGRSNTKAFCYLIVPSMGSVSDDARRRLRAIEAFSDLGSGFNIAMQDLDIRGAGNLLGGEQSGFIADMGFETYQRILSEAFMEIRQEEQEQAYSSADRAPDGLPGGAEGSAAGSGRSAGAAGSAGANVSRAEKREAFRGIDNAENYRKAMETGPGEQFIADCTIDTDLELLIPDGYIASVSEKIRLYKELDALSGEAELEKFTEALRDRFGPLPDPLVQLTYVVRLRREAVKLGFERIVIKNGQMLAYFVMNQKSPYYRSDLFSGILNYVQAHPGRFRVKEQNGKLILKISETDSMEKAYRVLVEMKAGVSALK